MISLGLGMRWSACDLGEALGLRQELKPTLEAVRAV